MGRNSLITRRLFLAWFTGTAAALVAGPAEARPRPRLRLGIYSDIYANTY